MSNIQMSALEKEAVNFDFSTLESHTKTAKSVFSTTATADNVKEQICAVWSKIGKYVKLAEAVPIIGKFITVLAELLDAICSSSKSA
ncbi:MAG: hypothetical protein QM640_12010 [Niabella sp.]